MFVMLVLNMSQVCNECFVRNGNPSIHCEVLEKPNNGGNWISWHPSKALGNDIYKLEGGPSDLQVFLILGIQDNQATYGIYQQNTCVVEDYGLCNFLTTYVPSYSSL